MSILLALVHLRSTLFIPAINFPHGFGVALVDFAFFVIFVILADMLFRPPHFYKWVLFGLCVLLALLFFFAWLSDLGAHL